MKRINQSGFTIVELMIATVVFSMVLLVVTSAIVQFGRVYYKGVIQSRTQERTRSVAEDVSKHIQFSGSRPSSTAPVPSMPGYSYICVGDRRYTYKIGEQQTATTRVLVVDNVIGGCSAPNSSTISAAKELAGEGMQLLKFVVGYDGNPDLLRVEVRMAYGKTSDMTGSAPADRQCKALTLGGQFCATAEFNTAVSRRLR